MQLVDYPEITAATRQDIVELLPHLPPMALLDALHYARCQDDDVEIQALVAVNEQTLYAGEQGVPAWVGMEYMAQTVGLYSGMQLQAKHEAPKIGFLVGARHYDARVSHFPLGSLLLITVQLQHEMEDGLSMFTATIRDTASDMASDACLATANLKMYRPSSIEQFMQSYA